MIQCRYLAGQGYALIGVALKSFWNRIGNNGGPRARRGLPITNYQRGSRLKRPPPPPPPPRPPRPPPSPNDLLRSGRGRASFTFRARPPTSFPSSAAMAWVASSSLVISTKAKPRGRPVSRSVITCTRVISPKASTYVRSSPSDVSKLILPTNKFFILFLFFPLKFPQRQGSVVQSADEK